MDDARYPVGRFKRPKDINESGRNGWIHEIAALPGKLSALTLTEEQLERRYRPDGWTIRQVINHLPDSHINAYTRFRFALTEDSPQIKPYAENLWAELPDAKTGPIAPSLQILTGLHERWVSLMRAMTPAQWKRGFVHPEHGLMPLDITAAMYAWHSRHHFAHITNALGLEE